MTKTKKTPRSAPRRPERSGAARPQTPPPARPSAAPSVGARYGTTTFRLWPDQLKALGEVALQRRYAPGSESGRPDHSALVREILDRISSGEIQADDLREALRRTRREALR